MIDRIVHLNDLSVGKGGASKLAVEAALGLAGRGLPVSFLAGDHGDSVMLREAGVEVVGLGQSRLLDAGIGRSLVNGIYNAEAAQMVRRWIASNDTPGTVYHLHGWAQILSPSVFSALADVRNRLVLHAHDFFLACPNGAFALMKTGATCPLTPLSVQCLAYNCDRVSYGHKLWRSARQAIHRHLYRPKSSPPVLVIHEAMRAYLMRAGIPSAAIFALPNPVVPFTPERIKAEENQGFVMVGRLESTKGPDLAAAAAHRAGVKLVLIGDGPMAPDIAKRYPDTVLAGRLPHAQIAPIVREARALLMPSRYPEPYGLVAMEAALSGLPVVLCDTALLAGELCGVGAALSVDPRDTTALAGTLQRLQSDDALCNAMSIAAFERTTDFANTPDSWIDKLIEHYRSRVTAPFMD